MRVFCLIFCLLLTTCISYTSKEINQKKHMSYDVPDVTKDMLNSSYWIDKLDDPDEIILTKDEIEKLNQKILDKLDVVSISDYDQYLESRVIKRSIRTLYSALNRYNYFDTKSRPVNRKTIKKVYNTLYLTRLNKPKKLHPISFGIITSSCIQKVVPTEDMYFRKDNAYFDRTIMSSLDIGTPVAILWKSSDRKWRYVRSTRTVGWVKNECIAKLSSKKVAFWDRYSNPVVSIKNKAPVYAEPQMLTMLGWMPLGSTLPLNEKAVTADNITTVVYPVRGSNGELVERTGYVKKADVNIGYLDYTARNIINLAFTLLDSPYGWGRMSGEQDCSGFISQIFNAVGIVFPRNSAAQGKVGVRLSGRPAEDVDIKRLIMEKAVPGATIIHIPGHIMLYLGEYKGEPYAIHSMWSYELQQEGEAVVITPGKVIVSTLNLSYGSKRGAYYQRIRNIRHINLDNKSINITKK